MPGHLRINEGQDNMFTQLKPGKKLIIGCIHLLPLPNTPYYQEGDYDRSIEKALRDAEALIKGGADGCLIQGIDGGIFPSTDDTDYARVACISVIGNEVRRMAGPDFKVGVQLMWNCITPSLAAAKACHADFTRCTALAGSTSSRFGPIVAQPLKVQNYRRRIGADNVAMIAEIAGYHVQQGGYDKARFIGQAQDVLAVGANAIEMFHSDEALNERMVCDLKEAFPTAPVVLGGGTDIENAARRLKYADCAIVGTCFEKGNWGGDVQWDAVRDYVQNVRRIEPQ